jgi:two-component system, OmpR family, phosphate regulon sensor histidine kinase PhoR
MRLASRVTLVLVLLAGGLAVLLTVVAVRVTDRAVEDRARDRLRREIDLLADEVQSRLQNPDSLDELVRRASARLGVRVTVIAPDGRVVDDSAVPRTEIPAVENHARRPEVVAARSGEYGTSVRHSATVEADLLYLARRIDPTDRNSSVLRLAIPLADLSQVEARYEWILGGVIAAACALLVVVGGVAVARLARPIGQVTEAALAVARGDLGRDPPESGPAEILELSSALRRMKASLLESVERVEDERRLAATVFETLPDGVVVVDARLRVLDANGGFRAMMSSPNPGGRPLVDILRDRELFAPFERALAERAPVDSTIRRERDVTWQIAVRPLPPGSRGAAVGILRDVTPLERNEAMRRRFVADVSHELRTPVASIAAAAETLADTEPDAPETPSLVELVRRQAERMRELIEDLTDLSLIESGAVALQREAVNLRTLACETAEEFRAAARARDVSIHAEADDDVAVEGDRRRIGQILRNLLDNAVKFSPPGGTVTVRVERSGERPALVVEDEGPGIAQPEQDRIFQRFYQVDRSRSKARPGTGLGLAIVKHLAHLHGAEVTVRSQAGRGSAFRVTFPEAPAAAATEAGGKKT